MSAAPDFAALRAERDAEFSAYVQRLADKHGVPISAIRLHRASGGCYCDCANHGPCEHTWDGKPYESDGLWSTTCSLCGTTAMSHDLHNAP